MKPMINYTRYIITNKLSDCQLTCHTLKLFHQGILVHHDPMVYKSYLEPKFQFPNQKIASIEIENVNYEKVVKVIKDNPNFLIFFDNVNVYDFYQKINEDLYRSLLIDTNFGFVDIDTEKDYWSDNENIQSFVHYIAMMHRCKNKLPFHFNPKLLEVICHKNLTETDLDYYGHKLKDYPKEVGKIRLKVYRKIAKYFQKFDDFTNYDIWMIDYTLSGALRSIPEKVNDYRKSKDESKKILLPESENQKQNSLLINLL